MTEKTFSVDNLVKTLNLDELVRTIRDCDQAENIEKNVLDYTWRKSAVNKSLLPLYIVCTMATLVTYQAGKSLMFYAN